MTDAEEAEVVAWLEGGSEKKIETGCAWVFLAGDTAFKVKKRVDLGFLDYSTLDLRHWALERELRLPLGPHVVGVAAGAREQGVVFEPAHGLAAAEAAGTGHGGACCCVHLVSSFVGGTTRRLCHGSPLL